MIYFKSIFAGMVAVIIAIVLKFFAVALYVSVVFRPKANEMVGIDVIGNSKEDLVSFMLIFVVGFVWEFRRAAPQLPN